MNVQDLKHGYSIYGNKGNVWNNTAHIYKNGAGTLCNTPALSTNWARIEKVEHIGCEKCMEQYLHETLELVIPNDSLIIPQNN